MGETQSAFEMKVSAPEVVTEVPADVVKNAKVEGNGGNEDSPASVNSN